jgi:hypothetical protein
MVTQRPIYRSCCALLRTSLPYLVDTFYFRGTTLYIVINELISIYTIGRVISMMVYNRSLFSLGPISKNTTT